MALAKLDTFALVGIDAVRVVAEVDVAATGLPVTMLVGLAQASAKESIHRVERAILNSGYQKPASRTVINLAPADLRKSAAAFDLSIALGLLCGTGQLEAEALRDVAVIGELALDGSTRPIRGALPIAMATAKLGISRLLVPTQNAREAAVVEGLSVFPVDSLAEAVGLLSGAVEHEPLTLDLADLREEASRYEVDFQDVRGQQTTKRGLVVAAAGGHNALMIGPPGTGKTMLARRFPTILPPLSLEESLETTQIYSVLGQLPSDQPLRATRPFRNPHHTSSPAGLIGGGSDPQPGEVSLAHHGVLFLDELPEFPRQVLEVLRQPLEDGTVTVTRASAKVSFPARFLLLAAMNPCPCGFLTDPRRDCRCTPPLIERYLGRISGPLLDRIDMHLEVPTVPFEELRGAPPPETSASLREQVAAARELQRRRFRTPRMLNGRMSGRQIRQHCQLDDIGEMLLKQAVDELKLSNRAHDRILRVARTVADLDGSQRVESEHLAEAIQFRRLDRQLWA